MAGPGSSVGPAGEGPVSSACLCLIALPHLASRGVFLGAHTLPGPPQPSCLAALLSTPWKFSLGFPSLTVLGEICRNLGKPLLALQGICLPAAQVLGGGRARRPGAGECSHLPCAPIWVLRGAGHGSKVRIQSCVPLQRGGSSGQEVGFSSSRVPATPAASREKWFPKELQRRGPLLQKANCQPCAGSSAPSLAPARGFSITTLAVGLRKPGWDSGVIRV